MNIMMKDKKSYSIVAVLWNDPHILLRSELPGENLDNLIQPTLTVGVLYKKTDNYIALIHTLERSEGFDEADYTIIFSGCIISMKKYGKIKLSSIRPEGAS